LKLKLINMDRDIHLDSSLLGGAPAAEFAVEATATAQQQQQQLQQHLLTFCVVVN
jgi:hypothetical protein